MRKSLYVCQVVVWTVFLEPFADILLRPQHHRFGQGGQRGTGVVDGERLTWTQLDALCPRLLQQFDSTRVRPLLATSIMPGQVTSSIAARQLVTQLFSRHRVLQGCTAKAEAGRRVHSHPRSERVPLRGVSRTLTSSGNREETVLGTSQTVRPRSLYYMRTE